MRIIKCDRCGKTIEKDIKPFAFAICDSDTGEPFEGNPFRGWDFCKECKDEVLEFARKKPEKAVIPVERIAETPEKPKAKASSLPKGIDKAKVVALRNAHWSIVQIADEMGCSQQRVGQILAEMKAKE